MDESKPPSSRVDAGLAYDRLTAVLYAYAGIINPIICFACAAPSGNWLADSPWQSGEFWVYATLMLKWPAVLPFYPLLLYSMASLGLLLWDYQRFAKFFAVRLGVYGGVALSILFGALIFGTADRLGEAITQTFLSFVFITVGTLIGVLFATVLFLIAYAVLKPVAEMLGGWRRFVMASASLAAVLLVAALAVNAGEVADAVGAALFVPLILTLAAGPTWSLLAYSIAAVELLQRPRAGKWRWKIKEALLLTAWVAGALAAWRRAMDLAIREYATLPAEDPNCFVCSAAANGHAKCVRSETIIVDGQRRMVTQQLRVLKAAELALRASSPAVHRVLRKLYNRIGPAVARRLANPWLADGVYLSLKPVEWFARAVIWVLLGASSSPIDRLYAAKPDQDRPLEARR